MRKALTVSLRRYVWVLAAGLGAQGVISLTLLAFSPRASIATHGVLTADARHASIHALWGLAMIVLLRAGMNDGSVALLATSFGMFYSALAVLGMLVHYPFHLQLGPGENGFHVLIGLPTLTFGLLGLRATHIRSAPVGIPRQANKG